MATNLKIFGAPGRYIQGAGAIDEIGAHIRKFGKNVLVVGGKTGLSLTRESRTKSFQQNNINEVEILFRGESSENEIERLVEAGKAVNCNVIIATGGGKVIDAVKAAAEDLDIPAVIIPTIASNDAPCSALSILYHEDGSFNRLRALKNSPSLVLVDTEIISRSPVRQLVSGMGDAIATWFEADSCYRANAHNVFGGCISLSAMALAKLCLDTLLEYGVEAKTACESKVVSSALEKIVEANTLLSGLGFESCGVSVAHALSESFSVVPEMHHYTHGEKVAFGVMTHLTIENYPIDVIKKIGMFCIDVGLPVTLSDLGFHDKDLTAIQLAANDAAGPGKPSHNLSFSVTGDMIFKAITEADYFGHALKCAK